VGEATVFVSWFLATPIDTLLDALANFLKEKGLREEDTFFWVCDYVIRQTNVDPDLALLGECVSAVGHTVLLIWSRGTRRHRSRAPTASRRSTTRRRAAHSSTW
jgi:hypothetical protein